MTESSTKLEYLYQEYKVRIQHCEHRNDAGEVCDEYLGVNYPSDFCKKHEPK